MLFTKAHPRVADKKVVPEGQGKQDDEPA